MRILQQFASPHGPTYLADFSSIDEELRFLRRMVTEFRQRPEIRDLAVRIITDAGCTQRDKREQAQAVGTWVQQNIYYVHELPERFALPTETLRAKAGDCDDGTTLICSLLESIGIPSLLIAMRLDGALSHIFPAAILRNEGGLLPLDWTLDFPIAQNVNPCTYAKSKGKKVSLKIV